jgi:putative ABC transport system permease protein
MHSLRNLGRRKVRTSLTILGITIGIWALVVFGSMANKIGAMVEGGSTYYADKITLSDAAGSMGGFSAAPMSLETAELVRAVPGVAAVAPGVMVLMDELSGITMGVPPMITGGIAGADEGRESFTLHYAQGRALTAEDEGTDVTVLGSDIARKYGKGIGDKIDLKDESFTVVGVLEPTLTAPDQAAMVPMAAAQRLLLKTLPPMFQSRLEAS